MLSKTLAPSVILLALLALFTGCGPKIAGAKITGTLVKGGQPFAVPDKHDLSIVFTTTGDKAIATAAAYDNAKKTFSVPGPTGHGLPPGNYFITVRCVPYAGADDQDLFGMQYLVGPDSKKPQTPLTYNQSGTKAQTIEINLDTNQVTAK